MNTEFYDLLATLLGYPQDKTRAALERCRTIGRMKDSVAVEFLDRFAEQTAAMTAEELQELYTRTFDLNPTCSLEVGWQLYGENYTRGEFLVAMRQTLRRLDVPESTELPDHLTHVLSALGRMDSIEASQYSVECLVPALEKMLQGLTGKDNPYASVLEAIRQTVGNCQLPVARWQTAARRELPVLPNAALEPSTGNCQLPTEEEVCHG